MNGLKIIDLNETSFMDRLLRREPRENAFVEINNLLACVPIFKLDREAIEKSLNKHDIPHEKARSRFLNFYSIILKHFLIDLDLDEFELERLHHLKYIFTLDDKEIGSIHRNFVQPIYKMHVRKAISDGGLTAEEKENLDKIAKRLYIPKEFAKKLYVNETSQFLHSVLKNSLADRRFSHLEEQELNEIAEKLNVKLKYSETAQRNLERCRKLWNLYQGETPTIKTKIRFNNGESCSASKKAILYSAYNENLQVKFSGYHESKGQKDVGFHAGTLKNDKLSNKTIKFIDEGTLYFTNKRLYFAGTNGGKNFAYHNLTGGTFFQNGLLIEKLRGSDYFFKFTGDLEELKLIFDNLMTDSEK